MHMYIYTYIHVLMMLKEKEAIDLRVEEYEEVSGEGT